MEMCADVNDHTLTLGDLSQLWDEPAQRIADAVTANRVVAGQRTYVAASEPGQPGP
jgi:hypothetical protein